MTTVADAPAVTITEPGKLLCEYRVLPDGPMVCDRPAVYRGVYAHCSRCGPECSGALICEEHAAAERTNPDLVRLTSLSQANLDIIFERQSS